MKIYKQTRVIYMASEEDEVEFPTVEQAKDHERQRTLINLLEESTKLELTYEEIEDVACALVRCKEDFAHALTAEIDIDELPPEN